MWISRKLLIVQRCGTALRSAKFIWIVLSHIFNALQEKYVFLHIEMMYICIMICFCSLFDDTASSSDYIVSNEKMISQ
jgi:hypothetical protein